MKLSDYRIELTGMLLKPNMVAPGKESGESFDAKTTADATLDVLREVVPPDVPGIVFLSGGIAPLDSTKALQEMNAVDNVPWQLSFSFARALQDQAMETWHGEDGKREDAQKVFLHRAKMNSLARSGQYTPDLE
jgi:fructose-bisphosphate aldolase class I